VTRKNRPATRHGRGLTAERRTIVADVFFTANLRRHVDCPVDTIEAATVRELLDHYFDKYPGVRGYVLDDQGHVRHHVKIIVDGLNVRDRRGLSDALTGNSQVHVFQALSGG
jgi:molybdopterin synthase sulfur carrier subunit